MGGVAAVAHEAERDARLTRVFSKVSTSPPARCPASRASTIGVCICPGTTVFTRMPLARIHGDDARELDHARLGRGIADLRRAGPAHARGRSGVDDRRRRPACSMTGITCLQVRNTLLRLKSIWRSQASSDSSTGPPGADPPTLLTRTSIRPKAATQASTIAATWALSVTSQVWVTISHAELARASNRLLHGFGAWVDREHLGALLGEDDGGGAAIAPPGPTQPAPVMMRDLVLEAVRPCTYLLLLEFLFASRVLFELGSRLAIRQSRIRRHSRSWRQACSSRAARQARQRRDRQFRNRRLMKSFETAWVPCRASSSRRRLALLASGSFGIFRVAIASMIAGFETRLQSFALMREPLVMGSPESGRDQDGKFRKPRSQHRVVAEELAQTLSACTKLRAVNPDPKGPGIRPRLPERPLRRLAAARRSICSRERSVSAWRYT